MANTQMTRTIEEYGQLAQDWVDACEGVAAALERLNAHYKRSFTHSDLKAEIWRRVYAFRPRSFRVPGNYLQLSEAQLLLAQDAGFGSWEALITAAATGPPPPGPAYDVDEQELHISPRRRLTTAEWDRLIDVMRERRIKSLEAHGLMTDTVLRKIAALDHVTHLRLGGSRELTDGGAPSLRGTPSRAEEPRGTAAAGRRSVRPAFRHRLRTFQGLVMRLARPAHTRLHIQPVEIAFACREARRFHAGFSG